MTTKAASKAQAKWDKAHTRQYGIKLNMNNDKDIIYQLETVSNKQDYIKRALRQYQAIEQAVKAGTPIHIDCTGIIIGSAEKEGVNNG